jgi:uncharacterized surface protein with fasciclin (FAS1) repeats
MKSFAFYNQIKPILIEIELLLIGCQSDIQNWDKKPEEMVISQYVEGNPDFSEFNDLLETAGLKNCLSVRGPYTLFLPDNKAMFAYYKLKNVNSVAGFSDTFKDLLIRNHIIEFEIPTDKMGLGTLSPKNAIDDYLVSEFEGSDIIISKYSKIIKRNIRTANGFIHVVDRVLDPVTKDIFSVVASDPSYKIFTEGLELSGIKDTLQLVSFPFGKTKARTRFTILAVADTIYNRYGIYNIGDLIKWCGASPVGLTSINNPFYRYMEYHCLNGSYYLSDLNTGLYPVLSADNNIMFTIDTDYKINLDNKTKKYTGFIIPASNTPAKNGALHAVNDILPVAQPVPTKVTFETTDFLDIKQGDYYGKYCQKFFDGEKTFAKIHWKGDYLLYHYNVNNYDNNINGDCLNMKGWWTISITFPKVMKGKYKISIYQPYWPDVTNCVAYVDGVVTPYAYAGQYGNTGGRGGLQQIAEVDFTTTVEHTISLRNNVSGGLYWDYVIFDPVK